MKKIFTKLLLLGLAGLSLIYSSSCQKNNGIILSKPAITATERNELEKMLDASYRIKVKATYVDSQRELEKTKKGIAFLAGVKAGEQYFITNENIFDFPEVIQESGSVFELKDYKILLGGWECSIDLVAKNEEEDIAILKSRGDLKLENLIGFVDGKLERGQAIYAVSYREDLGKFLTRGKINYVGHDFIYFGNSNLRPTESGKGLYSLEGPLYILEDGKPKLLTVGSFMMTDAHGIFGQADYKKAKEELEKILRK